VIGIIGIIASVVIVAINPRKQLCAAQDAKRQATVHEWENALMQALIDGWSPSGSTISTGEANARPICRQGVAGDATCVSLDALAPTYLATLPVDEAESNPHDTGYRIYQDDHLRLRVTSVYAGQCGSAASSSGAVATSSTTSSLSSMTSSTTSSIGSSTSTSSLSTPLSSSSSAPFTSSTSSSFSSSSTLSLPLPSSSSSSSSVSSLAPPIGPGGGLGYEGGFDAGGMGETQTTGTVAGSHHTVAAGNAADHRMSSGMIGGEDAGHLPGTLPVAVFLGMRDPIGVTDAASSRLLIVTEQVSQRFSLFQRQ
jgi:hypothetical protein